VTNKKIMIIDDDAVLLKLTGYLLKGAGYEVVSAKSAAEATELYAGEFESIHLVCLDRHLGDSDGLALFSALKIINPGIKALLMSGFIDDETESSIIELGIQGKIQKPFSNETFIKLIESLM